MTESPYSARQSDGLVRLRDAAAGTTASIKPSAGNNAFELLVNGSNALHFNGASAGAFKGGMTGVPFLGPWANRLDEQAFYANGRRYAFDMTLGNIRGEIPIHGFLTGNEAQPVEWDLIDARADDRAAWAISRLDVSARPVWMKQFPFAHTLEMTYRLERGVLEVRTAITNRSAEPMPVAIGFHPYFQLTDSTRDDWTVAIGARRHWRLASTKVPTGETEPIERQFRDPSAISLREYDLDDVYSDLVRGEEGRATMTLSGPGSQRIDVQFGPNWRAAVIWAPPGKNFVCFEPMAAITNAMNLAHKGQYADLQSIPPGGTWAESFWIRPIGF